ncbi:MAG: peptide-methionine (S)-S-oxide reductase MsrA [Fusobacteriaceae bacterium]
MKTIYLAGGCFWGVENYFQNLKGVIDTKVGYANSITQKPNYQDVCSGKTQATETCRVTFDESLISFEKFLNHFFSIIDPTIINRQGNDIGSQYRTGIYYLETLEEPFILKYLKNKQKEFKEKIVTEVLKLENFYLAEEEHQSYLIKNPHGYCHCIFEIEKLKQSNDSK